MKVAKGDGVCCATSARGWAEPRHPLLQQHNLGSYSTAGLTKHFGVGHSGIYRTLQRLRSGLQQPARPLVHLTIPHPTN